MQQVGQRRGFYASTVADVFCDPTRVQRLVDRHGSVLALAKATGARRQNISAVLDGRSIGRNAAERLAKSLGMSLEELTGRSVVGFCSYDPHADPYNVALDIVDQYSIPEQFTREDSPADLYQYLEASLREREINFSSCVFRRLVVNGHIEPLGGDAFFVPRLSEPQMMRQFDKRVQCQIPDMLSVFSAWRNRTSLGWQLGNLAKEADSCGMNIAQLVAVDDRFHLTILRHAPNTTACDLNDLVRARRPIRATLGRYLLWLSKEYSTPASRCSPGCFQEIASVISPVLGDYRRICDWCRSEKPISGNDVIEWQNCHTQKMRDLFVRLS